MTAGTRTQVFDAPLHVRLDKSGMIHIFLPDGSSVALTENAAAASLHELSRAVAKRSARRARPAAARGNVIEVDFQPS